MMPPSSGGLCEGVITIPSARPEVRPRLYVRMACEITGVGVALRDQKVETPFAPSTSSAVSCAGSERACVSLPRKSGPLVPCALRYSHTAWVTARMCASLNARLSDEPRCPLVPNATRCSGTAGSGRSSK